MRAQVLQARIKSLAPGLQFQQKAWFNIYIQKMYVLARDLMPTLGVIKRTSINLNVMRVCLGLQMHIHTQQPKEDVQSDMYIQTVRINIHIIDC